MMSWSTIVATATPRSRFAPTTATASSSASSPSPKPAALQGRNLHDYLLAAITAALHGQPAPSLPPAER